MNRLDAIRHEFVEFIPESLEPGVVYVSIAYATTAHLCCCGCGSEAVNPLAPHSWRLTFDGQSISFSPSIGNWSFPCRSHYWIEHSRVHWAGAWSEDKIEANRAADLELKRRFYEGGSREPVLDESDAHGFDRPDEPAAGWRRRLRSRLSRR